MVTKAKNRQIISGMVFAVRVFIDVMKNYIRVVTSAHATPATIGK
jgi:hypothetical protein